MGKVKNLEKKNKSTAEFDKKTPANRVKSINDDKLKKKVNQKTKKTSAVGGAIAKEAKPLAKEAKKEIAKALKAKKDLKTPKTEEIKVKKDASSIEVPEILAPRDVVKKAVKAAKDGVDKEKEASTTKTLFDDEMRYGLQVVAIKIPKTPPHTKKILLDHSLFGDEQPDICFIIRDQKGKKDENVVEETIMKFEELLKEAGVTGIKSILPLSKLKKDYGPNNMKLKLLNTYDLFLVESEVAEHAYTILGKHFIKKRKRPLQVDTTKKETIKITIENAKRKVSFKVSSNSNFSIFEVGTHKTENSKIVDNIVSAMEQLKEKWPGGWKNILRLYLKPMKQSKVSIPIYYSKINPNDIEVPVEIGVKQTRLDKLTELLAKKSKKLRIDRKSKKIVKAKGQAPPTKKVKTKKDKKRKHTDEPAPASAAAASVTTEVKKEAAPAVPEKKAKKNKKTTAVAPVETPVVETSEPKKKKKKSSESEAVVEAPKEGKKKNKVQSQPEPTVTKTDKNAADKKKKSVVDEKPLEKPAKAEKTKNKKK